MRWILALLSVPLVGCISVDVTGIEGFSATSASWVIAVDGQLRSHSLHLSDASDYCSKLQVAEQERVDSTARHQQRLDDGAGICESTDLWYDDLAAAQAELDYDGARLLMIVLDHPDATNVDAQTAPAAGNYLQRGTGGIGGFAGDLVYRNGSSTGELAEAYTCTDPDSVDIDILELFQQEEQVDLVDRWTLDSGELTLGDAGDDAWDVAVSADLLDGGSNSVGTIATEFTVSKCEVAAAL